jgi:hypothetical protein
MVSQIRKLVQAGLLRPENVDTWTQYVLSKGYTPGVVSLAVTRIIDAGDRFPPNLAQFAGACRDETARLNVDEDIERDKEERSGSDRWKGTHFFKMIQDAMSHEDPVDVRKSLIRANHWGRDNSPLSMKPEWDKSDREHLNAIEGG